MSSDWPHRSKADLTRQETGGIREIEIKYLSYASQSQTSNPSPLPPSLSIINIITITATDFCKCNLDGFVNQGVAAQELQRNIPLQCRNELKVMRKKRTLLNNLTFPVLSNCEPILLREAFGFICRDQATTGFLGYIFK